jgi:hypothetical protein
MNEQFTKGHCKLAIDACQRLAALPQHPMSAAFWRGMERLWRERLGALRNRGNYDEQESEVETPRHQRSVANQPADLALTLGS